MNEDGSLTASIVAPPEYNYNAGQNVGPTYPFVISCSGIDGAESQATQPFTYQRGTTTSSTSSTTSSSSTTVTTATTSTTAPPTSTTSGQTPAPTATASDTSLVPGEQVALSGSGWKAGSPIEVELHSTSIHLATVSAGSDGTFSVKVKIPSISRGRPPDCGQRHRCERRGENAVDRRQGHHWPDTAGDRTQHLADGRDRPSAPRDRAGWAGASRAASAA